jgi:CheY-like chemotaxis protein
VKHLACGLLQTLGYEVLSASNGQDGLHAARNHKGSPIRLVVTDVVMPVMGGRVMAEWLKTTYPDLKILFTSGYTDDATERHGLPETGVECLFKPYAPATLARKVREMLDESG